MPTAAARRRRAAAATDSAAVRGRSSRPPASQATASRAPGPGAPPPATTTGGVAADHEAPDWGALRPRGDYARRGKRLLDLALLVTCGPPALLLSLPIALLNATLHGPRRVLFLQERVGERGRTFTLWKFRTMREPRLGDPSGTAGDAARVTAFGRFLRCTHLDELPQLVQVLRGEMSFVGPRPEMVELAAWAERTVPGFERRLALRPGITGWAQITEGYAPRDPAAYERKLRRDEVYRRALSLRFDLLVLVLTARWMLRGRGWAWRDAGGSASRVRETA